MQRAVSMIYRTLGKTGLQVSQLGFGAMRLPMVGQGKKARINEDLAVPMIQQAFTSGVNYIDTAVGYCNDDSQRVVGLALQGWRDRIIVSTKNPYYQEEEKQWWQNLENSLQRLQVDEIDIYNHHGLNWEHYTHAVAPRISKWMHKAKDQGLIKHICCSFHDTNDALIKLIATDYPEVITLQYNMLDRHLVEGIAAAHEKGIGVVVMGPVAGGALGSNSEVLLQWLPSIRRVPELALRFVLANPNVSVALSGMNTLQQVEQDVNVASDSVALREADHAEIEEHLTRLKALADLYCTQCGYCQPCPQDVPIPRIFGRYNLGRVYGLWEAAREQYDHIGKSEWDKGHQADACNECGECEEKCPQNIPIREQLKKAHTTLKKKKK